MYALYRAGQGEQPWVQYEWSEPVSINRVEVYWAVDHPRSGEIPGTGWPILQVPESYRILYWNGSEFARLNQSQGFGSSGACVQYDHV